MSGYILDTNIFNRILDGEIEPELIKDGVELFATHIELDELQNTPSCERREDLADVFQAIGPEQIPTESAVYGVSRYGLSKYSAEYGLYQLILEALNVANGGEPSNVKDALIAETAIRNKLTLVTEDSDLATVVADHGGSVIGLGSFMEAGRFGPTCASSQ